MDRATAPGPLLEGKVAIVTGGAAGIGLGVCRAFTRHGAFVLIVDIDEDKAVSAREELGDQVAILLGDVRRPETAEHAASRVLEHHGRIDVLVNNVGHYLHPPKAFEVTTDEEWDALYAVNLYHVLTMTRAVLGPMIDAGGGGSIINMSTVEAFRGIPQHPVYAAFKAGVTQFGRSLAVQVARHGIRVNDIAPDVTRSEQLPYDRWLTEGDRGRIPNWVPLGRLGEPSDAAGAAVFLASDLGGFVTGTTIHCDGGTYAAGGWYPTARRGGGWTNRPFDP
jgi:NAD(P)-dependent dehydrogenase (short-subunit alcohol dehydrogenase family)